MHPRRHKYFECFQIYKRSKKKFENLKKQRMSAQKSFFSFLPNWDYMIYPLNNFLLEGIIGREREVMGSKEKEIEAQRLCTYCNMAKQLLYSALESLLLFFFLDVFSFWPSDFSSYLICIH